MKPFCTIAAALLLHLCQFSFAITLSAPRTLETSEDVAITIYPPVQITQSDDEKDVVHVSISCDHGLLALPVLNLQLSSGQNGYGNRIIGHGSISSWNEALTNLTFTPDQNHNTYGSAPVDCSVSVYTTRTRNANGPGTDRRAMLIDVLPVNDPPKWIVESADLPVVEEDQDLILEASIADVDFIDRHSKGQSFFCTVQLSVSHGIIKLSSAVGLRFVEGSDASKHMRFRAAYRNVQRAISRITYRGFRDYSGEDSLDLYVSDEGNIGAGGPLSSTITIPVSITPKDDAPTISCPNFITCGEEEFCKIGGIYIQDPDPNSSGVRFEATVELGRLDFARSAFPPSISVQKMGSRGEILLVAGNLEDLNNILETFAYHGAIGTHAHVDTIKLRFSSGISAVNEEDRGSTTAIIHVVITNVVNNHPKIIYGGAVFRDDIGCSANIGKAVAPIHDLPSTPSHGRYAEDPGDGICNRLVETRPFACTEDTACLLDSIIVRDDDSTVLKLSLQVTNGSVSISDAISAGLEFLDGIPTSAATDASAQRRLVMRGSQDGINTALSSLAYVADHNYNGNDRLIVNLQDIGRLETNAETDDMEMPIVISSVDDAPLLQGPTTVLQVDEDDYVAVSDVKILDIDNDGSQHLKVGISVEHGIVGIDSSRKDRVEVDLHGTQSDHTTATNHTWWSRVLARGDMEDLNNMLASLTFTPDTNWGGYAIIRILLFEPTSFNAIDEEEIYIEVTPVNDPPRAVLGVKGPEENETISLLEDTNLALEGSVHDVDDGLLEIELTATNGSLQLFERTETCFVCQDLDNVITTEGPQRVILQGTTKSINHKLGAIQFTPEPDYSGEAKVSLVVRDTDGATDFAEVKLDVIAVSDAFEVFMPVSIASGQIPAVMLDEGSRVKVGADWRPPRAALKRHSISRRGEGEVATPYVEFQRLDHPRAFYLFDKEDKEMSSFCADLSVAIGSISIDDVETSSLDIAVGSDNKSLVVTGKMKEINLAGEHIIFAADTKESGRTSLDIIICEGGCGWHNLPINSRGCAEASFDIFVDPVNNAPTISIVRKESNDPPRVLVALNSKEVPVASISIDDTDQDDKLLVDSHLRSATGVLTVFLSVTQGTVSLHSLDGLTFINGTGVSNYAVEFISGKQDVNNALSKLYFSCMESDGCTPGPAYLNITVHDNGFTGLPGPGRRESLSSQETIEIEVVED